MDTEKLIKQAFEEHQKAFREWKEGEIVKHWIDDDNNLCIEYESGNWWHYKFTKNELEWW